MSKVIHAAVCFSVFFMFQFNELAGVTRKDTCDEHHFECKPGECVVESWVCDGESDCSNGKDENNTKCDSSTRCSNATEFDCGERSFRCIPLSWHCDRQPDCNDGKDEKDCLYENGGACPKGDLFCKNGKIPCIPKSWICDGEDDCPNGIDESNCTMSCAQKEFSCNNGTKCISKDLLCDDSFDCADRSDEAGCLTNSSVCSVKQVRCQQSGECIPASYLCDGDSDCKDNSDELSVLCSKRSCSGSQWRCLSTQQCINITSVCDGQYDCKDQSDERTILTSGTSCSRNQCAGQKCSHKCQQTPVGPKCYCPTGFELRNDAKSCQDINECERKVCDHYCKNKRGSYKCWCYDGFQLVGDNHCKSLDSIHPTILVAQIDKILNSSIDGAVPNILYDNLQRAVAIDYHFQKKFIFFTDVAEKKIYRATYGKRDAEPILSSGLYMADGIAVDWIGENIYFTESKGNRIDVIRLDGKFRRVLIENLGVPRGLAVDPKRMYLFYTDWGAREPKIGRCSMDGMNCTSLINTNITWPNAITLDYINEKVYWADARLDTISVVSYNGDGRSVVAGGFGQDPIPHPFAITLYEGYIYVTDWRIQGVYKVDLLKNGKVTMVMKDLRQPMDIQLFHPTRQNFSQNYCKSFGCEQLGFLSNIAPGRCQCACDMGSKLLLNGKNCTKLDQFVIVAMKTKIRGFVFNNGSKRDAIVPIIGLRNGVGVDYDVKDQMLYYSDVSSDTIQRVGFKGANMEVLINQSLSNPDGLAVDWVGRNLYWTDAGTKTVSVSKLNGKYRRTLFKHGLDKPRGIVVHPKIGKMFWADWGIHAKIERASMDGSGRNTIVNGDNMGWPNGLAIDYETSKLYWVDARLDVMMSVNFDGSQRQVIFTELSHPFGIDVYKGYAYWSDWSEKKLFRANITQTTTGDKDTLLPDVGGLMEVRVYQPELLSDNTDACWTSKESCQQLCLLRSSDDRTCACQDGYKLTNDNTTCVFLAAVTCPEDQFLCSNSQCIPAGWVCDGDNDCLDNSDEHAKQCQARTCKPSHLKCQNSKCIPKALFCDGDDDCGDGSDEICTKTCPVAHLACDESRCVPDSWKCDGTYDCVDRTDEMGCGSHKGKCSGFKCVSNGNCLSVTLRCNGEKDCVDNSDEEGCLPLNCSSNEFRCADGNCIESFWKCDGDGDCDDESDEVNCTTTVAVCPEETFQCKSRLCIPMNLTCNHEDDCGDQSDEMLKNCGCKDGEFRCTNFKCVNKTLVCNRKNDCGDSSDEKNCTCRDQFKCASSGLCIMNDWKCDGEDDCGDNSDETISECGPAECPSHLFSCPNSTICLSLIKLCDQKVDCPGGEDEGHDCLYQECGKNKGGCSHNCTNSPHGALCSCPRGMKLDNDNMTCTDIDECALPWACSQTCINSQKSYYCECVDGYSRGTDGRSCHAIEQNDIIPFILVSNRISIQKVRLRDIKGQVKHSDVIRGLRNTIGVDFDWKEQRLYWTDVMADKIQRANFNGSHIETVVSGGLLSAEGIAVDWIGRNLYWLDMRADKIEVSKLDGRHRSVLIDTGVDSPRAMQLDPRVGFLFWTDWGNNPRIERANMDGGNRTSLITQKLVWPNAMTLDYANKRIYWMDARFKHLELCDYEGGNRHSVLAGSLKLQHPFSSSLFEDKIFWTDWAGHALRFTSKYPGGNVTELYASRNRLMDLHVVHPVRQPSGVNHCAGNPCSHLCVLKPAGYKCLCPIGFKFESITTCKDVNSFLVYSRRYEIKAISLTEGSAERMVPVMGLRNAIGIDFDYSEDRLYWTDVTDDSISRIFVNGTGHEKIIKPGSGLRSPDGIAVDWVAKNIYWTDSGADVIAMARTDGQYHRVVLSKSKYLSQPRGIAIYPSKGFLFWTDWGLRSIQRASLNGDSIRVLVNTNLYFVNGITIDYSRDRIYWADATYDKIESSTFSGKNRRNIVLSGLKHPFGISVLNGSIYWSDWVTRSINKADVDGKNQVILKSRLPGVMDVCVFDKSRQPGNNRCGKRNGNCPELCLWTGKRAQCACQRGFNFNTRSKKCEPSSSFLVLTKSNEFLGISFDPHDQAAHLPYISVTINCFAADFLYADGSIYFTDDAKDVIGRINTDGSGMEYVITTGLQSPHGIAVDWVGRNLYWTDMGTKLIEVSRLNGSYRLPLITTGLDKPRAIVLYPAKGMMFWTDWGQAPKIQRAYMDGSSTKALVSNNTNHIFWPNGLTIDYETDLLYWIDGRLNHVGYVGINGGTPKIFLKNNRYSNGYALTIFGNYIYATFTQRNTIVRINKNSGKNITFHLTNNPVRGTNDVFAYDKSRQLSGGACAINNCEQLCLPTGKHYRCACASEELSIDGKHCRISSAVLIYATGREIRFLHVDPRNKTVPYPSIYNTIHSTVTLDFDYEEKLIFFTVFKKSIMSVYVNGSGLKEIDLTIVPDGISVDWMAKKIYVTDALNDKIRRIDYDGSNMTNIISAGLKEPRAIAVMPCESMIYWTDWGVHSIERALLRGVNRQVLVNTGLVWPNGLTIDTFERRMYWIDAQLDIVESANLDGSDRRMIVDKLSHPFAITVFGSSMFWTDWDLKKVMKANKFGAGGQIPLTNVLNYKPMDIQMFTPERQNCTASPCMDNGGCSHECTVENGTRQCKCPTGFKLYYGFWCASKYSNCSSNQFTCANGHCISRSFICDTDDDCSDRSDELPVVCAKHTCPANSFQCNNGKCIAKRWRCDFDDDCHDNSDEMGCERPTCLKGQFPCDNGRCISESFRCDADNDCRDFSDESGCPTVTCPPGREPCSNNSMCIRESWICDGDDDCGDYSDESKARCSNTTCSKTEIKCTSTGRCIPASWRCDGDDDCGDNSDELGNCKSIPPNTCKTQDFACRNGNCVSKSFLCDGDNDCGDNSDENIPNCTLRTCGAREFKCYNASRCIPRTYVCDGDNDCGDASDEDPREGCSHPSCSSNEFRCGNSICIRKAWRCDHENDCGDGSDELSCTYGTCNPKQFTCKNKQCIAKEYKCDADKDCADGSDEEGCTTTPTRRLCTEKEFQCKENGNCIPSHRVCDKVYDCRDKSDEKNCHVIDECHDKERNPCQQICKNTIAGFECSCKRGYNVVNVTKCVDIDECLDYTENHCSQSCFNIQGHFKCMCGENYKLTPDQRSCKYIGEDYPSPYLLFADRYDIRRLSPDSKQYVTILSELVNAVALDYDYNQQRIYWSTSSPKGIKTAFINGTDVKTIIKLRTSSADGLAVDWIERNLYFCESSEQAIYVSKLNGLFLKKLVTGLKEPRGMAVYPQQGYLYFTDWRQNTIFRVGMDGSDLTALITNKVGWPNGITIDYTNKKLFWIDARLDAIDYADMDGKNRQTVPHLKVTHPFAITLFEEQIFWTDWATRAVFKAHKWSGKNQVIIKNTTHKPMDIQVVHPLRQPAIKSKCPTEKRFACQGLCLLTPGLAEPGYRCACPENYYLAPDNKQCFSNCSVNEFSCNSLKCIAKHWRCDGENDCGDNSDEPPASDCPKRYCPAGQFQCDNHNCTSTFYVCDGENDCDDYSDERNCSLIKCSSFKFRCDNHKCIPKSRKCDGQDNCGDGSDEKDCKRNETCKAHEVKCKTSGECIFKSARCNGYNDCQDKSDEDPKTCPNITCPSGKFYCSYRCIPQSWVCDDDFDCPDRSDESHCSPPACPSDKFSCKNKVCIPLPWRCDYNFDCSDRSDEDNCSYPACNSPNFRCNTSKHCMIKQWRCDGQKDCKDGSDENNCEKISCAKNEFRCRDGYCIQNEWRCDGSFDCKDQSDEIDCGLVCSSDQFQCNNTLCVNKYMLCDGYNDCRDNSDEKPSMCAKHRCTLLQTRCKTGDICVPSYKWCDGDHDCPDKSDEPDTCVKKRTCNTTDFKCLDGRTCVPLSQRCNQRDDCGDGSDETKCSGLCSKQRFGVCQQNCTDVAPGDGYYCSCRDGFEINKTNSHFCEDIDECSVFGKCSQKCVNYKGGYKCSCFDGYQLIHTATNSICRIQGKAPTIWLPSHDGIRGYSSSGYDAHSVITSNSKVKAVDFMVIGNITFAFWINADNNAINMAPLAGNGRRKKRDTGSGGNKVTTIVHSTGQPICFALDWIGNNIYWINHTPRGKTVEFSSISGRGRRMLANIKQYNEPTQVVLYPEKNKMFWSVVGLIPKIEMANLTGGDRKVFLQSKLSWPTGLAIDPILDRLFWCDMKENEIETIFTNGTDRRIVVRSSQLQGEFSNPYSIDVFEDYLYITTVSGVVFKWNKFGHGGPIKLVVTSVSALHIKIYHKVRRTTSSSDTCKNNPCSHICLPHQAGPICLCPNGEVNKKTCEKAPPTSCFQYCVHGICEMHSEKPACLCYKNATGVRCNLTCADYNCSNNGKCVVDGDKRQCRCPNGTTGDRCELKCNCTNNGKCVLNDNNVQCRCPNGTTGDRCEVSCADYNCSNNGKCVVNNKKLHCRCHKNATGVRCNLTCADYNCSNNGKCVVDGDKRQCRCPNGTTGDRCEVSCADYNCSNNGKCVVNNKKLHCRCREGTTGDRCQLSCADSNCSNNEKCVIDNGKLQCRCREGTTGDRCQLSCADSNCSNNGKCVIDNGKLQCRCREGTTGDRCQLSCADYNCNNNGKCVIANRTLQCRCEDNTIQDDCLRVQAQSGGVDKTKLLEIIIPCVFALLVIVAIVAILYCRWRGIPSRKFSAFYGSRKASFTYTGMFDEDEEDDGDGNRSRQFVINDSEVNFANPVYNSLFLEGPSRGDYAEVNRQLIFQDDESRVDFSNPIYDSFYGNQSKENSELDLFLPKRPQSSEVSSGDSFGSHDSLRDSMARLVEK